MENVIEAKIGFFEILGKYPEHIPVYFIALAFLVIIITLIKNPNLINNLLNTVFHRNKDNKQPEKKEKMQFMRRKDDIQKDVTITEQLDALRKDFTEQFNTVNINIEHLFSITANNKQKLDKVSQGTLESLLFNGSALIGSRILAFKRLTAMGINSDVKDIGFDLVLANKAIWKIIKKEPPDVEILDHEYYTNTMKELENKISEGGVKT